ALRQSPAVEFLAFLTQQPIDVDLGRIWMGGIAHHRHRPEAIAAVDSLLDGVQRLYRQVGLDIWIDKPLRQAKRDDERSFCQTHGKLLAIAADEQLLLGKFL